MMVLAAAAMPMVWSRPTKLNDGDNPLTTILTGGAPNEIYSDFENRFQLKIHTAYAQTEAPVAIMAPRVGTQHRKATPGVGVPMALPKLKVKNKIKIIDDQGKEVPRGQTGQIIIKNSAVMLGYYKDPVQTAHTKIKGWIHTGDIGFQDESGYFFFLGRKKDVLRHRGELISPAQIESVINGHPMVIESAVIGVPSGLGVSEEDIMAFVKKKHSAILTQQEIVSWCASRLPDFKMPRYIEFRHTFSKTSLGKIQKNLLKLEVKNIEGCYDRLKEESNRKEDL